MRTKRAQSGYVIAMRDGVGAMPESGDAPNDNPERQLFATVNPRVRSRSMTGPMSVLWVRRLPGSWPTRTFRRA
ncbi:MAG: hypothetical protein OXJ37_09435 [Bryobacterales bacterium]|nr:hypothetical protein [Bryobacterales bacterium]MDE0262607.1 hypothetical protein [Bryobacterales bacterium]